MDCTLYVNQDGNAVVAGTITLDGTSVSGEYQDGFQTLVEDVLDTPNVVGDKVYDVDSDPGAWFNALPQMYHGSYMWASMVGQKPTVADILNARV